MNIKVEEYHEHINDVLKHMNDSFGSEVAAVSMHVVATVAIPSMLRVMLTTGVKVPDPEYVMFELGRKLHERHGKEGALEELVDSAAEFLKEYDTFEEILLGAYELSASAGFGPLVEGLEK